MGESLAVGLGVAAGEGKGLKVDGVSLVPDTRGVSCSPMQATDAITISPASITGTKAYLLNPMQVPQVALPAIISMRISLEILGFSHLEVMQ